MLLCIYAFLIILGICLFRGYRGLAVTMDVNFNLVARLINGKKKNFLIPTMEGTYKGREVKLYLCLGNLSNHVAIYVTPKIKPIFKFSSSSPTNNTSFNGKIIYYSEKGSWVFNTSGIFPDRFKVYDEQYVISVLEELTHAAEIVEQNLSIK